MSSFVSKLTQTLSRVGLAAVATVTMAAAHADVVYSSLPTDPAQPIYDTTKTPATFVTYLYQAQCFASCKDFYSSSMSEPLSGIGDLVSLTPNTGRALTGVTVGLVTAANTAASSFSLSLSFFDTSKTLVAKLDSGNVTLPATGSTVGGVSVTGKPTTLTLNVAGAAQFNLPDTFYYLITVSNAAPGLGVQLYDYYHDTNLIGTDVGTTFDATNGWTSTVYGTLPGSTALTSDLGTNNGVLTTGFTPAIEFDVATPVPTSVPEPSGLALVLGGLAFLGLNGRKRRA